MCVMAAVYHPDGREGALQGDIAPWLTRSVGRQVVRFRRIAWVCQGRVPLRFCFGCIALLQVGGPVHQWQAGSLHVERLRFLMVACVLVRRLWRWFSP